MLSKKRSSAVDLKIFPIQKRVASEKRTTPSLREGQGPSTNTSPQPKKNPTKPNKKNNQKQGPKTQKKNKKQPKKKTPPPTPKPRPGDSGRLGGKEAANEGLLNFEEKIS